MNIPHKTKLVTALGLVYILWGSTYLGMKIATEILPPFLLSAIRFVIAGSIMFGIGLRVEKEMPTGRQWLNAAFIGVMLIGIGNSSVALAVRYMPSGLVALFIAALPAWFIALDWAFFSKERPKALTLWGLFLGFAGLCFIFNPLDTSHRDYPLWPIPILTFGSVSWALGSLLSPRLNTPKQLTSSGIQMLAGVVSSVILSALLERQEWGALEAATLRTWSAVLYLVIFGSLIGYTAYSWLVNNAPARLASTYAYVNPVVAILLGWLVVDETLSGRALTGSAIVIAGVVLMTLKKNSGGH